MSCHNLGKTFKISASVLEISDMSAFFYNLFTLLKRSFEL